MKIARIGSEGWSVAIAAIVGKSHCAHSIRRTPEFTAPELYEENYTEPYRECDKLPEFTRRKSDSREID
ncbi:hypothetical protein L1887_42434 [Cichorium endivia]|nr:hypothetical protein L1887_42434 [Cichorium endivia]